MKCGHIVTVGTSLTHNTGGDQDRGGSVRTRTLAELDQCCSDRLAGDPCGQDVIQQRRIMRDLLLRLSPQEEFGYRSTPANLRSRCPQDRLPQELSYLWGFAHSEPGRSQCFPQPVRLLASDTNECINCALVVAGVLREDRWNGWYAVSFDPAQHVAKGVDATKGGDFARGGIHSWIEKIQELIVELTDEGCECVFLNVTGGYKGTVPYSTLMGMLCADRVRLAYLFEESPEIIEIPAYPIGLDFRRWHENALRLRMAMQPEGSRYFAPDRPVRALLHGDSLSALGRTLEQRYDEQVEVDPLKLYSKEIVERLLNDKGPWLSGERPEGAADGHWSSEDQREVKALRDVLHNLLDRVGDIIWLGDKLPEMVDHAQRHHHDLLEFTELFLTPILYHQPLFVSARERFVLLSAVMLHDCGHSLDRISIQACRDLASLFGEVTVTGLGEEIVLFPDDVRAYHQHLAGIRLNDQAMASDLDWPGREGFKDEGLPEDLHDAVILACLYHRRRMAYERDDDAMEGILHLTGQYAGALICHSRAKELRENANVDLMKVVALLRLVDGCDSQARRAGPRLRLDLTGELLERDYCTAAMRAEQAWQAFVHCADCVDKARWAKVLIRPAPDGPGRADSWRLDDKERRVRIECLKRLRTLSASGRKEEQCARLWLVAAEAVGRAQMRFSHFPHFMKHRAVREIRVLPAEDFGPQDFAFNIVLVPGDDDSGTPVSDPHDPNRSGTIGDWLQQSLFRNDQGKPEPLFRTIEREVSSEYAEVAAYVQKKWGLKATYWWKEAWERREHLPRGQPFYPDPEVGRNSF